MDSHNFESCFQKLTGNAPFPWQAALYQRFLDGNIPQACNLPTGLGKTSVIGVWLIALANGATVPRRLVYVVNRRTVVDQTTDEVEKYRANLLPAGLWEPLARLTGVPLADNGIPLAVSTLRGQFADNREWSTDPSRPAVISGTVDMIGSRLLFSGYGVGMKARPLHAAFLGQDVLLVHDEAHLEPAFQHLISTIESEQKRCREFGRFQVMALTATPRTEGEVFELTPREKAPDGPLPEQPTEPIHHVWQRIQARKGITFHPVNDEKKDLVPAITQHALTYAQAANGPAVLIFVRSVKAVTEVVSTLRKNRVPEENLLTLTGTLRGLERDRMATESPVFARFRKGSPATPQQGTVYLVCTSAGEVGVDLNADHLICDLSTCESMAQRFGRVNRYGHGDARIDLFHPTTFDTKDKPFELARERTLALLLDLRPRADGTRDASPAGLADLLQRQGREPIQSAFAPEPTILPATDILFDAWALTTITNPLPGRPPVEPYLHGLPTEAQPPETQVAWREEVFELKAPPWSPEELRELLDEYPLKPVELLRDTTTRVFEQLKKLAASPDTPVWLVAESGAVNVTSLARILEGEKEDLQYQTILLPPSAGGLNEQGMLDASAPARAGLDVSGGVYQDREQTLPARIRLWSNDPEIEAKTERMRLIRTIDLNNDADESGAKNEAEQDRTEQKPLWLWFTAGNEGDRSARKPVTWEVHVGDVVRHTEQILERLPLSAEVKAAILLAARFHDHGKRRKLFQTILGNAQYPTVTLAKSGRRSGRVAETYRHEFGSLLDIEDERDFRSMTNTLERDLVLHLIAAHHGRARPHFPGEEAFDPERTLAASEALTREVPRRFARLQRRYGRWGLAYLESLLRAADWAASANPSAYLEEDA